MVVFRFAFILFGNSGSAITARPVAIKSALLFCRISSAASAVFTLPTTAIVVFFNARIPVPQEKSTHLKGMT